MRSLPKRDMNLVPPGSIWIPLLRLTVSSGSGGLIGVLGYLLARSIGSGSVCAAGRSPASLAVVLGIAATAATWSITRTGTD